MTTAKLAPIVSHDHDNAKANNENKQISLDSLSLLTGFPVSFIKRELVLKENFVSMKDLRQSMMAFLHSTFKDFEKKE